VQKAGARQGLPSSATDTFLQAEMKTMLDRLVPSTISNHA
jgi:hypothetical protein